MGAEKSQEINENVGVYRTSNFEEILKKKSPAVKEHCFNAYVVKEAKSDTTHCEHLCLAGAIAPSFTCWLTVWLFSGRDLRNSSWTICTLPMSSKESGEFYSYWIRNIHTGSEYICCQLPSKEFIHTWYKLLTPHSRLRDSCWFRKKHSYRILFYSYQIRLAHFLLKQSYRALLHAIEFNYRQVKMFIFT